MKNTLLYVFLGMHSADCVCACRASLHRSKVSFDCLLNRRDDNCCNGIHVKSDDFFSYFRNESCDKQSLARLLISTGLYSVKECRLICKSMQVPWTKSLKSTFCKAFYHDEFEESIA